ncbi:MAG TPA: hypothetical protein VHM90_14050 [Phycisphaerae bacterium]|nr:hypothetical protein [Phycisphaerae bacterium]
MRFLIHGAVHPEAAEALARHEQACHTLLELSGEAEAAGGAEAIAGDPALLLPLVEKKQWNLLTTDTAFVRDLYEKKVEFAGVVVQILDDPDVLHDQGPAIDRLFERYKRLTPRRLYTVTASRVKIRQLPGGHV